MFLPDIPDDVTLLPQENKVTLKGHRPVGRAHLAFESFEAEMPDGKVFIGLDTGKPVVNGIQIGKNFGSLYDIEYCIEFEETVMGPMSIMVYIMGTPYVLANEYAMPEEETSLSYHGKIENVYLAGLDLVTMTGSGTPHMTPASHLSITSVLAPPVGEPE